MADGLLQNALPSRRLKTSLNSRRYAETIEPLVAAVEKAGVIISRVLICASSRGGSGKGKSIQEVYQAMSFV